MFSHCAFYYCSVRFFLVNLFTCIQRCITASPTGPYFFSFPLCRSGFYHPPLKSLQLFNWISWFTHHLPSICYWNHCLKIQWLSCCLLSSILSGLLLTIISSTLKPHVPLLTWICVFYIYQYLKLNLEVFKHFQYQALAGYATHALWLTFSRVIIVYVMSPIG